MNSKKIAKKTGHKPEAENSRPSVTGCALCQVLPMTHCDRCITHKQMYTILSQAAAQFVLILISY